MTEKKGMTCAHWGLLIGFGVLGIFTFMMLNLFNTVSNNRQERVQEFFDHMASDDYLDAYKMLANEWQIVVENTSGLARTFEGIEITNTDFGLSMGACYTETTIVRGERRPTSNSQQYFYTDGTADVNGEAVEISANMTYEDHSAKIVGFWLDDDYYGVFVPDDCYPTD